MILSIVIVGPERFVVPLVRMISGFIEFLHWCEQAALFNIYSISHKEEQFFGRHGHGRYV